MGRGFALGKLGRYEEEIECCNRAIELDPNCLDAWNNMAFAFGMLDRFEEKIECCDQALAVDPENATAWNNKGVALGMLGQVRSRDPLL